MLASPPEMPSSQGIRSPPRALGPLRCGEVMDQDLNQMTRAELIDEVKWLRQGIRAHRDCETNAKLGINPFMRRSS